MNRILALQRLEANQADAQRPGARVPCFSIYASLVTVSITTTTY